MNVIERSLTVFLYGSVWSTNWTVYEFHVKSTRVYSSHGSLFWKPSKFDQKNLNKCRNINLLGLMELINWPGLKSQRYSVLISAVLEMWHYSALFSADSEHMKNISADQRCFRADQLWLSLIQCCSELKNSALFQRESALNQRYQALIFLAL